MKAFTLDSFDTPPGLREDLPAPTPADNEVLVRVRASSINNIDAMAAAGALRGMMEHRFPVTIGRDFAGVVEEVGSAVTRYRTGDELFGMVLLMVLHEGTWADYILLPEDDPFVMPKPARLDFTQAGAAPLAALTALAAVDAVEASEGDTVLIGGASGGVGSFAVQLAAQRGARVTAPGLPADEEFLRDLGAAEVIDRNSAVVDAVLERHPQGADGLVDLVSYAPEGFEELAAALKEDGRGASALGAAGEGPERFNVQGAADPARLGRLARLLEAGQLRVPIQKTYSLEEADEALEDFRRTHTQGKRVITVG